MGYISYFSTFEKIKEILANNRMDFSSANVLYDELNLDKLKLLVVLFKNGREEKINKLLKDIKCPTEIVYIKENELDDYLDSKKPQELLDELVKLWYIAGFGISTKYFDVINKNNKKDLIYLRKIRNKQETLNKDFKFIIRNGAGALLFNPNLKKFLLLRHNIENEEYWNIPKGGIEEGETTTETVKRELREEAGIIDYSLKDKYFVTMHTYTSKGNLRKAYITHFAAITKKNKPELSSEHIDYKWLSFKELLEQAHFPNQKWVYYKLGNYLRTLSS